MRLAVTMSVPGCMLSAKYVEAVLSFSVSVLCSGRFDVSAQNTRVCVQVALDAYIYTHISGGTKNLSLVYFVCMRCGSICSHLQFLASFAQLSLAMVKSLQQREEGTLLEFALRREVRGQPPSAWARTKKLGDVMSPFRTRGGFVLACGPHTVLAVKTCTRSGFVLACRACNFRGQL